MFPSVVIFVLLLPAVVDALVYSQGCIANKNTSQMSSDIAIADSVWARSTTFKGAIIGNSFCCFTPVYSFAYPLRICFNNNDNDPSGSLLGSFLKYTLKD